jgi:hypothetical protein
MAGGSDRHATTTSPVTHHRGAVGLARATPRPGGRHR